MTLVAPSTLIRIFLLDTRVVWRLLRSFEFLYCAGNWLLLGYSLWFFLPSRNGHLFAVLSASTLIPIICCDAAAVSTRRNAMSGLLGVAGCMTIMTLAWLDLLKDTSDEYPLFWSLTTAQDCVVNRAATLVSPP